VTAAPALPHGRLIVSADDFGLSPGVNRGIEEAFAAGGLSGTSVMVTLPAAEAAGELARRHPELDIGVHVNLTHGPPALDPARVPSLVDGDGRLLTRSELLGRLVRGRVSGAEVRAEVGAQFARLRELGVEPTHWDSHQHIAFVPGLARHVCAAARAAGMRRARTPRVWVVSAEAGGGRAQARWRLARPRRFAGDAYRALLAARMRRRFATPAWQVAPELVLGAELTPEARWDAILGGLGPGVTEAVTHPGYADDDLAGVAEQFVAARANDLAALTRLGAGGLRLARFRELDG
jgi:chitin disaccharide deacetylase